MSGGLPANFSFKKKKGKKLKARKFDIGAQLRKEAQPVKIEKTDEEKTAEEAVKTSEWQEAHPNRQSPSSFQSNFGSIQKIVYVECFFTIPCRVTYFYTVNRKFIFHNLHPIVVETFMPAGHS